MRNSIGLSVLFIAALMLAGCQMNDGGSDSKGKEEEKTVKNEYIVTFDNNCPLTYDGGNFYSCSENAPSPVKAEEGTYITLPSFDGKLTRYVNNETEGVYSFKNWNTASDGSGTSYDAGTGFQVTGNITLYAVYETASSDGKEEETDTALDFSKTTSYSMKAGDTADLKAAIGESSVYYSIQSGSDVVELGSSKITAIGPGTAVIRAMDWDDSSKAWYCTVTVTVEGFSGSALDYKLSGKWIDGSSFLLFNTDYSGELKVYKNGEVLQKSTFSWSTTENSYGKYLTLTGCSASYLEGKQYTIQSISSTGLTLKGYLAFLAAETTSWTKE